MMSRPARPKHQPAPVHSHTTHTPRQPRGVFHGQQTTGGSHETRNQTRAHVDRQGVRGAAPHQRFHVLPGCEGKKVPAGKKGFGEGCALVSVGYCRKRPITNGPVIWPRTESKKRKSPCVIKGFCSCAGGSGDRQQIIAYEFTRCQTASRTMRTAGICPQSLSQEVSDDSIPAHR